MDILAATKYLLKIHKLKPHKSKSQHFLISEKVYQQIIKAAELGKNDTVLEIGPGLGFLTTKLLEEAREVVAVEIDESLFSVLEKLQLLYDNLQLVREDVLKFDENSLPAGYKIVANIPYHLTGQIIRKFLSSQNPPQLMVVLVQKEVAERICAAAGEHSLLSLAVQYYGQPQIIKQVKHTQFYPPPKVDSVILKIANIKPSADLQFDKKFWQVVRIGFSSKRKTLAHNLAAGLKVDKQVIKGMLVMLGLNDRIRAQELSLDNWKKLVSRLIVEKVW